ncbi:MAG: hypothetical protein JXO22_18075 [Phycisphaerae bacterium]|nr:hypothetical protein [Phycisphaerae bacterium]
MLRRLSATMMVLGVAAALVLGTTGCDEFDAGFWYEPADQTASYEEVPYQPDPWYYFEYYELWY